MDALYELGEWTSMSWDKIPKILINNLGDIRRGEAASRDNIANNSPQKRINDSSRYLKADGFHRRTAESLARQVQAHNSSGLKGKEHSTGSARGQRVLKELLKESDSRLPGLTIHDAPEAAKVTLATNSQEGHDAFANLFRATDTQRSNCGQAG